MSPRNWNCEQILNPFFFFQIQPCLNADNQISHELREPIDSIRKVSKPSITQKLDWFRGYKKFQPVIVDYMIGK